MMSALLRIGREPLDPQEMAATLAAQGGSGAVADDPGRDGAVVTFLGLVRNHNARPERPISGVRGLRAAGAEGVRADRRRNRRALAGRRGWRCITGSAGSRSAKPASRSRRARRIAPTRTRRAATRSSA